jgi:transcriptional regulator with XRE-family HTH domain
MKNFTDISEVSAKASSLRRAARRQFGLSLTQAAAAMFVCSSTIESWENSESPHPSPVDLETHYEKYFNSLSNKDDRNLIFGIYPLRLARDFLRYEDISGRSDVTVRNKSGDSANLSTISGIAAYFNYSPDTWRKFESNARSLPADVIREIEELMRGQFSSICARGLR